MGDDVWASETFPLEVEVNDPPEAGRLYGPDGELLAIVPAYRKLPAGFRPGGHPGPF